jgi:hypothetical protein
MAEPQASEPQRDDLAGAIRAENHGRLAVSRDAASAANPYVPMVQRRRLELNKDPARLGLRIRYLLQT